MTLLGHTDATRIYGNDVTCIGQRIALHRGDSLDIELLVTEGLDREPRDLTGSDIEFQVKAAAGAADPPLIVKAVGLGVVLRAQTGTDVGVADIAIVSADTLPLTPGVYQYDVVLIDGELRRVVVPPSDFVVLAPVNDPETPGSVVTTGGAPVTADGDVVYA